MEKIVTHPDKAEHNVQMVNASLWISVGNLFLVLLLSVLSIVFYQSEENGIFDMTIMLLAGMSMMTGLLTLSMSFAGMISSSKRLKAFLSFVLSIIALSLYIGAYAVCLLSEQ